MVQIVIVEPHPLLRLGLSGLMACLTSADHIKSETYDDLYHSPPQAIPADLVLLGARPEERINLLIQAARRAHSPKRMVLMSDSPAPPASWTNLPSLVVDYICTGSSAEAILAAVHSLVQPRHAPRSSFGHGMNPRHGLSPEPGGNAPPYYPQTTPRNTMAFKLEVDEARMLGLSPRQYEVLVLLAQGYPIKLICRQLNISLATTKGHLEALYQRLGVHNRNEAVFVAMAQGAALKVPPSSPPLA